VASRVKSLGATGSVARITEVIPLAFNLAITCDAVCWIEPGSSTYGITSAGAAPTSVRRETIRSASTFDSALLSM